METDQNRQQVVWYLSFDTQIGKMEVKKYAGLGELQKETRLSLEEFWASQGENEKTALLHFLEILVFDN